MERKKRTPKSYGCFSGRLGQTGPLELKGPEYFSSGFAAGAGPPATADAREEWPGTVPTNLLRSGHLGPLNWTLRLVSSFVGGAHCRASLLGLIVLSVAVARFRAPLCPHASAASVTFSRCCLGLRLRAPQSQLSECNWPWATHGQKQPIKLNRTVWGCVRCAGPSGAQVGGRVGLSMRFRVALHWRDRHMRGRSALPPPTGRARMSLATTPAATAHTRSHGRPRRSDGTRVGFHPAPVCWCNPSSKQWQGAAGGNLGRPGRHTL